MELKPCPFCGGEAVMHERFDSWSKFVHTKKEVPRTARYIRSTQYPDGTTYHEYREKIFIPQCCDTGCVGRTTKPFKSKKEAAEAWNRRVDNE